MKKFAGALLAVLMVVAGLLFSTTPSAAQDVEESPDTEGAVADFTDAQQAYLDRVEESARRGAEGGLRDLEERMNRGLDDLLQKVQNLEERLTIGGNVTWLPEFCLRWLIEINKTNAITDTNTVTNETESTEKRGEDIELESKDTETEETVNTRTLAGQFLKSRVGAMLIFIVNGVELCAMKVDLR